jgi:hypothetical protein
VLANLVTAGASVLVGVLLLEGGLRLMSSRGNIHATATLNIYAADPELGWRLRPHAWKRVKWLGRQIVVRIDAEGHRVPDRAVGTAEGPLLAFAGDSYTFGNEVEAEESFAWQAGRLLGAPVVNLGVGGYSLDQECRSLERYVAQSGPLIRHAILAVFVGNDIEYGAAPAQATRVDPEGYLVDADANATTRTLIVRSQLFFLLYKAYQGARLRRSRWRDHRAAPPYRWIYDEQAWGPGALECQRQSLRRLAEVTRRARVPLTVVLLPEREQVYGRLSDLPSRNVMALLASLEIRALDLLPALRARALSDSGLYHHAVAGHFSPSGHAVVASAVAARLRSPPRGGASGS